MICDVLSGHSGTTKFALNIASGFIDRGAQCKLLTLKKTSDALLLEKLFKSIDVEVCSSHFARSLSMMLQYPLIKFFESQAFNGEDAINIFGALFLARKLKKVIGEYDILIFINIYAAIPLLLSTSNSKSKFVLYFHEPPLFAEMPYIVRKLLVLYVKIVSSKCTLRISTSDKMRDSIKKNLQINTLSIPFAFSRKPHTTRKEDFIIADTRWTGQRDPFFLLEIASRLPRMNFKMCGKFGNHEIENRFLKLAEEMNVRDRIEMLHELDEDVLDSLFRRAKCYVRWGTLGGETGTSFGVFQSISNGCIPIISDDLGSAEFIKKCINDDVVVKRDPSSFSAIINRLVEDDNYFLALLQKVIKCRDNYAWSEYVENLMAHIFERARTSNS